MFQTQKHIERRTGKSGTSRIQYLTELVKEFQNLDITSSSITSSSSSSTSRSNNNINNNNEKVKNLRLREQVLANLANFAYDPINYEWFRQLNIIQLFLDVLDEKSDKKDVEGTPYFSSKLVEFAVGGLCNCCLDPVNAQVILDFGLRGILSCLASKNIETVLSSMTTLNFLLSSETLPVILSTSTTSSIPLFECLRKFSNSANKRIANMASIFLSSITQLAPHLQPTSNPPSSSTSLATSNQSGLT